MRLQYERVPRAQWKTIYAKLHCALFEQHVSRRKKIDTAIYCFDSDFLLTTNINDARWLFVHNKSIVKLGNDGSVVHLIPQD